MSRRSLIFCLSALAAMIVAIVVAVAFLYDKEAPVEKPVDSRYSLVYAMPPNAVMACFLSESSYLSKPIFSSFEFTSALADFLVSGEAGEIVDMPMAMSMYYSGSLTPFYVFDAGSASEDPSEGVKALMDFAISRGYQAEYVNCSDLNQSSPLSSHSLVLISKTKTQLNISKQHMIAQQSLLDVESFAVAAESAPEDVLFISFDHAKVLFEKAVSRTYFKNRFATTSTNEYSGAASFFYSFSGWAALDLSKDRSFTCIQNFTTDSDFMGVLDHGSPAVSSLSSMLPSYTYMALSLPMMDASSYISSYSTYLESEGLLIPNQQWHDRLKKKSGVDPLKLVEKLGVKEMASASFKSGNRLERVNLAKIERADTVLLRGTGKVKFESAPEVMPFAYADHFASVFGKYFRLSDESYFTYMNGWLVTGNQSAVSEYVSGRALEYPLNTYMSDAGQQDLLADRNGSCVVYVNIPKGDESISDVLKDDMIAVHSVFKGDAEYAPIVLSVYNKGGKMHTDILTYQLEMNRRRAPQFERDTLVTVPTGPFKVINSGTGRVNLFYQQTNGAICLKEEDGKGIWGVPFSHALCGTAHNIDYYANGNKQILFGAGSSIYLIDRTGRYVNGFPVSLGKDILLGPDVYDFNGVNSYNVLVLHKDNTIDMYNLHGKKPDSWKGIAPDETIKSLPEKLNVDGKTFWAVRTSRQILIYPFYGGAPLNSFSGDKMFHPNAEIKVKNSTSIEAECYDGVVRSLNVK